MRIMCLRNSNIPEKLLLKHQFYKMEIEMDSFNSIVCKSHRYHNKAVF